MSKQYSIAEAREKLAHVIQEAEQGAKVELTRRGKPVAILLSLHEYERLSRKRGSFWQSYQEFAGNTGMRTRMRSRTSGIHPPGRDFSW